LARDHEPEILTPQEAADLLRVSLLTVQRQAKAGRLPGRRVGKVWRFSRSVLLEWVGSGPDRHDLELYNRGERDGDANEDSSSTGEQLQAEGGSEQA
jgi:excisionase family DNA binding protein